jgi:hypothetical protein
MTRARMLVESATIIAGQSKAAFCYVCDKPRAVVCYARTPERAAADEARIGASVQKFYNDCRQRGAWVGD